MEKNEIKKIYDDTLKNEIDCLDAINKKVKIFDVFYPENELKGVNQYVKVTDEFFAKCSKALEKIEQEKSCEMADKLVEENTPISDDDAKARKQIQNLEKAIEYYGDSNEEKKNKVRRIIAEHEEKEKIAEADEIVRKFLPIKCRDDYYEIDKACKIYEHAGCDSKANKLNAALRKYDELTKKYEKKYEKKRARRQRVSNFFGFFGDAFEWICDVMPYVLRTLILVILPIGLCAFAGWVLFAHSLQIRLITGCASTGGLIFVWVVVTIGVLALSIANLVNIPEWDEEEGRFWAGIIIFGLLCGSMYPFLIYESVAVLETPYHIANHIEITLDKTEIYSTGYLEYTYSLKNNTGYDFRIESTLVSYLNNELFDEHGITILKDRIDKDDTVTFRWLSNDKKILNASQDEIGFVFFIESTESRNNDNAYYHKPYERIVIKSNDFLDHSEEKYNEAIENYKNENYYDAYKTLKNLYSYKESSHYTYEAEKALSKQANADLENGEYIRAYKSFQELYRWNSDYGNKMREAESKQKDYANNLAKKGKIEEALAAYQALTDLGIKVDDNISQHLNFLYALQLAEDHKFDEAKKIIDKIGDYKQKYDFNELIEYGKSLSKEGKIEEAITAFEVLKALGASFNDPDRLSEYVHYTYAVQLVADHKFDEAKAIFLELGSYKDCVNYYLYEVDYQRAIYLYEQGKYTEAQPIFESLNTYSKSKQYYQDCVCQTAIKYFNEGNYVESFKIFDQNTSSSFYTEYMNNIIDIVDKKTTDLVVNNKFQEAYDYLNTYGQDRISVRYNKYSYVKNAVIDNIYGNLVNKFGIKKLILPETITTLTSSTISGAILEEIVLPSTLTEIKSNAFRGCRITKPLYIPEGFTTFENSAFASMSGLTELHIPSTAVNFGKYMFDNTQYTLDKIYYNGTKDDLLSKVSMSGDWLYGYNGRTSTLKIYCTDFTYYCLGSQWVENN